MPNAQIIYERMKGDTLVPISATLTRNGSVVDLTGKTVSFRMIATDNTVKIDSAAATVVGGTAGTVSYTFLDVDVDTEGEYWAWWIVTSDGKHDHFPHDGRRLKIVIKDEEGTVQ